MFEANANSNKKKDRMVSQTILPDNFDFESESFEYGINLPKWLLENIKTYKNSQDKNYLDISKEIREFSKKIKANKILPDEINGSSFTISNLSSYNVEYFNPIINPPEVAILGVGKITKDLSLDEDRNLLESNFIFLSLTFDHRALDGVPASNFLDSLISNIESI